MHVQILSVISTAMFCTYFIDIFVDCRPSDRNNKTHDYDNFKPGPPLNLSTPKLIWIYIPNRRPRSAAANIEGPNIQRNPVQERLRWPNGQVHYLVNEAFTAEERQLLASAMEEIQSKTCIRFFPADQYSTNYIKMFKGDGCYSMVGQYTNVRELDFSLGSSCWEKYIIIHELLHSVGFYHEQSRWDRDQYIKVYFENMINEDVVRQFDKNDKSNIPGWDQFPYDYKSIMHYNELSGSGNGKKTMEALQPGITVGNEKRMTQMDVDQINFLYNCQQSPGTGPNPVPTNSPISRDSTKVGDEMPKQLEIIQNVTLFIQIHDMRTDLRSMVSKGSQPLLSRIGVWVTSLTFIYANLGNMFRNI